jgi:lipid II:glycine glycyltransferase (peptidoglycan interpeptide bridge formation enzyme)
VAYVPKGPLADPIDRAAWSMLIDAMHTIARQARAIFLKIEPDWPDEPASIQQLLDLGLRPGPSVQPKQTLVLDLTRSPDELLAAMKPKTRYNIGLASRKGVLVREGTPADLPTFHQLMQVTGRRDGFATHTREYYEAAWQLFAPSGHARLFLATCDDQVIAGLMAFAFGDKAWYLYGASSDEHRQRMPNHLLQWEAIRWAKAQGCRTYDLWGIPAEATGNEDDLTERRGGLWGVYRFKAGFGGRLVRYVGAFDFIYRPLLYKLYSRLAALR